MVNDIEEGGTIDVSVRNSNINVPECVVANRKERRKMAKKEKRKKMRKELAELARMEEEARINDPEEQLRLKAEEEIEKARIEKERIEFEERERKILEDWEIRKALEEDEEKTRIAQQEEDQYKDLDGDVNGIDEDGWEYVEEGPPEIIWQGNEIIVKKKIVRVKKNDVSQQIMTEEPNRPTSNPPPPQSEAFADYKSGSTPSAQQLLNNVAQQTPNFGTEQDKSHCPFHLKTGACRFGSRCSRIHFYPDKSCTLLMKNMYNGPGLAWEQDEGLEHTDEEIEHAYEEFYEDVHTEFLKFGEIVNFKVCRNGSPHLRGNVYVHYTSLDSALSAYQSLNGRYFAGKQIQCEYVGVIKWRVAICGEFMKSKLKTCSRGMTCNFIHCFRNPSGDYEWADWDKPPPRYWLQKMVALFGYFDGPSNCRQIERESPRFCRDSSRTPRNHTDRYHIERSQSREDHSRDSVHYSKENTQTRKHGYHHRSSNRKQEGIDRYDRNEESSSSTKRRKRRKTSSDSDSDKSCSDRNRDRGCNNGKSECREHERHGRRIRDENDRDSVKSIKDRSKYYHREHSQEPSYSGRSYRSYSSRRDSCEPENESPYRKKISKRNRETETVFDSETRVNFIEEKEYCSDDESGRWEPETGVSLSTDISVYSKCNMNST